MAVIGSLTVKLGLVTVEWDKATAKAKQEAKDLQSAFGKLGLDMTNLKNLFVNLGGAAGLSVAGLTAMTAAIMDMASKMQDLADSTGLTEGRVLQFQKALVVAGGKAEDAGTILGTLFSKIAAARDGNDVAIAQFEQLGISFQELKTATPDEVIKKVYDGLAQISDSFERVRVTKELLGKAGLGKSITEIADALGKSTKKFDEQAETLQKWDKMADALEQTYANLKMAIAELLAPFTTQKIITVEQFKAALLAIGSALVVGQIMNLVAAFKALNTALKGTAALSATLGALKGGKGLAMSATAIATYLGVMKALEAEEEDKGDATTPPTEAEKKEAKPDEGKKGGAEAAKMRLRLEMLKQELKFTQQLNYLRVLMLSGSEWELKLAESKLQKEQEIARAKSERNEALAKENLTLEQKGLIQEEYNFKLTKAESDAEDRVELINAQREKSLALFRQENDFQKSRNILIQDGIALEGQRRNMNEGEFERMKAQLSMGQRLLDIEQQKQRYALENKDAKKQPEYAAQMARFAEQETAAKKEFALQVENINREEQVRRQLLRQDLEYQKKNNELGLQMLELQTKTRYFSEAEILRSQENISLRQKLLDIEHQRETLRASRTDTVSEEYQAELQRLANLESAARAEAKIRLESIAAEEKIRHQLLDQELSYMKKRNDLALQMGELQNKARTMSEFDVRRAQEGIDLTQRLRDIEQQRENLRTNRKDISSKEYQAELQRLNNMEAFARAEAKIRLEGIALDEQEAKSWAAGWEAALRDFGKNVQRYGDVARNMFSSVVGNMNSAIDNFVRTGKLSFKDLAKSIIQDLIAIQLKAQAAFLFNAALQGMGFTGFTAKAGGGAVSQSIPYMVGENGPELFVPQTGGAIIPNERLAGAGGMGGQTINYNGPYINNMSAIDTQSGMQFIAKNKMAVWSANQSAQRSIPQSR